jgi:ribonuclease T2
MRHHNTEVPMANRYRLRLALLATLTAVLVAVPERAPAKKKTPPKNQAGNFSYYLLALSWAPDFCAVPTNPKDPAECGKGRKVGFVVHGLWPQADQARGPENCGGSPVSRNIVNLMLNYIPTASLIQHEWTTHGTCSGLNTADYFAAVRKARDSVTIPADFRAPSSSMSLGPKDIEARFAAANPSFPKAAFRTSCTSGALQEARICFSKDLFPRACTTSAGECMSAAMTVLPVQ